MNRWLILFLAMTVNAGAQERLLSAEDFASLERENALWRSVKVDANADTNLRAWKAAGFTEADMVAVAPKLTVMWETPFKRQFGWLSGETVEKIQALDAVYLGRLRAARLRVNVGVQLPGFARETPLWVHTQWRRATLRALDYGEIAEFNRMNSEFARRVGEQAETLQLTADERRTLIDWEREFSVTHGSPASWSSAAPRLRAWHEEAQAELHDRTRALLGDERSVDYLSAANREFDRMCTALTELDLGPTPLLDLWALRREYRREVALGGSFIHTNQLREDYRIRVAALLGEETFSSYAKLDEARWLFPRVITREKKK